MSPPASELSLEACLERHRRRGERVSLAALATVDSTNRLARRVAGPYLEEARPVPRLVLLARGQTAGRGRRGRAWSSPPGQGIYTSLLLPVADAAALAALPLRVPLALCEALAEHGFDCAIKWPNDLVAGGRKLGGVLIEALAGPRAVVVGYGINGSQEKAELPAPGATSLRLLAGAAPELSPLAVDLALAVLAGIDRGGPLAALVEAYAGRSAHRPGEPLRLRSGGREVSGRFAGFDERGRLRLDTADGPRVLGSAEAVELEAAASPATGQGAPGT